MRYFVVSHTHWDREWYRTFQEFRARLVDAVDLVLDRLERDPEDRFVLDGQSIVLEDYLELRPRRAATLARLIHDGRLAVGPWYVQPDTLLPSGESLIRNLEEGERVARAFGPPARVAYTPDSFGHPAQLPQILRGFGLRWFVFWRGLGSELDRLPAEFAWQAPDGSTVCAHHLRRGYFSAARLPSEVSEAVRFLVPVAERLGRETRSDAVVLMNGIDHAPPDPHVRAVAQALSAELGAPVQVATLDEFTAALPEPQEQVRGAMLGARVANLLPGVWSSRLYLKQDNRRCESLLLAWAEPWAALALACLQLDERAALRCAWRWLLQNHAHDSICGCSQDQVHEQMRYRFAAAEELARETTRRVLERFAGHGVARRTPATEPWEVVVFNPSPHWRSDVVRIPLDAEPWIDFSDDAQHAIAVHPLLAASVVHAGFSVGGQPARLVNEEGAARTRLSVDRSPLALECFVRNVPPFGCVRLPLRPTNEAEPDAEDSGREITNGLVRVWADDDGTFGVRFANGTVFSGLAATEDQGDRGDTYDFDPAPGGKVTLESVGITRRRHRSGIQILEIAQVLRLPMGLTADRERRGEQEVTLPLWIRARLLPELERVDVQVAWDNTADDHRLRLLFPSGKPTREFLAASTFDIARWKVEPADDATWVHPAPRTIPHQGWVHANGLTVVAPGLPEAEVRSDGTIAITLVRAVGWLSLPGLATRAELAGPMIPTPGAQCRGRQSASLHLLPGVDTRRALDAEVGLWGVIAGSDAGLAAGESLLDIEPLSVVLSAFRPWTESALMLRILNPTDSGQEVRVRFGFPVAAVERTRLDGRTSCGTADFDFPYLRAFVRAHEAATFLLSLPHREPLPAD